MTQDNKQDAGASASMTFEQITDITTHARVMGRLEVLAGIEKLVGDMQALQALMKEEEAGIHADLVSETLALFSDFTQRWLRKMEDDGELNAQTPTKH